MGALCQRLSSKPCTRATNAVDNVVCAWAKRSPGFMMCSMSATARAVDHSAGRLDGHPTPPATRLSARRWRDPRVVVGVGLVALSVLLGTTLLGAADDTVAVWRGGGGPPPGAARPPPGR